MDKKKNIENIYPLSPVQQGILFHTLYAPKLGVYVVQIRCILDGSIDVSALERAWQHLVERHSVLRTSFHWERRKDSFQVVHRQVKLPFEQQDWRGVSSAQQQKLLKNFLEADCQRGFDLDKPPLMRITLIQLAEDNYQFVWSKHHLILDGWSTGLVLKEAFDAYEALLQGRDLPLARSRPYGDYIVWLQQQDLSMAEAFWRDKLKGFTAPTPLRVDRALGSTSTEQESHDQQQIQLTEATTAALQSLAQHHQLTLNTLVQGAFAVLLSRYSGEKDIVFGATVSGRPPTLAGVESMVGIFINTLPVRVHVAPGEFLLPWLKKLQAQQAEARQYEYSPLVEVHAWSDVQRGMPLFESIFVFENYPVDSSLPEQAENLGIREVHSAAPTNYPLSVAVDVGSKLSLSIGYNCQRLDTDAITRMLEHLRTLLEGMVTNPNQLLHDLQLLTTAERHQLVVEWNDTQSDYPKDKCIHQLFEATVERSPDAIAVAFEDQQLSYRELNARANRIAHHLRTLGVGPEVLVGICLERSLLMVVGLLGILKAGGAYVPLDPTYPSERLAFMLSDSQVSVLLTTENLMARLPELAKHVVCLDKDWASISQQSEQNLINGAIPENLAYVIYTSGSTGKPKGVLIQHRSLVNYTETAIVEYALSKGDRILQFASISFDTAAEEIFPSLVRGATLILRTDEMLSSIPKFLKICRNWQLTVLDLPTAFWHQMVTELSATNLVLPESVRLAIVGGETALPERLATWQQVAPSVRLVNSYGPTEATIVTTTYDLSGYAAVETGQKLPIGKAISNAQTYILDPYLQPTPVGVPGELYIGGVGVARGYLNRPELTAERFVPNPFSPQLGARLYKTGDLVRYRADGNIEFLGRIDDQVKIRGFRIELGEIETVLDQHPAVRETVVLVRNDKPGNQRLVAYVVPNQQIEFSLSDLRNFLKEKLPDYMMPSAFVMLEALPLTPNGKVDRQKLPIPDTARPQELEKAFLAPRSPIEEELAKIWSEVLNVEQVGVYDDFFELGGHSLLTVRLLAQVRTAFQVDLPLRSLIEAPTVAGLAESIGRARRGEPCTTTNRETVADLNAEAVLDPKIYPETVPIEHKTQPACIFLTGATGFLGAFLLYELLQQTQADVYCLVRSSDAKSGKKKLQSCLESYFLWNESLSTRIIPVVGDLSQPLLGLSDEQFREMAELLDVIYHNGAWVHHTYPYSVLKATNVLGTQEVLRLASQIKVKPVHFISTSGVFSSVGHSGVKVVREQDRLNDYQVPSGGYVQSKWVAEKLLNIAHERGIPICIHRPGRISGHSQTGVFNPNDFLYRLIIGCIQLGSVPEGEMIEDMAPVDYISKAIVYLSRQEESLGKAFHFVNAQPFHSGMLLNLIRSFGYPLQQISYDQWRAELLNIALTSPEHALYPLVQFFPARESKEQTSNSAELKFDCQNTINGLAGTSIVCPPIDDKLFRTYFSYLSRSGFLDVFEKLVSKISGGSKVK